MNLLIHSKDLTNNRLKLDNIIQGHYQLSSFTFTNNIFNITDNNNKIYFTENSVPLTATLTNGFFDTSSITSNLSTALNASASGTITCSLDTNTNKLTISNASHNFYFTFATNTSNSARKLLGFNQTDGTDASSQTSDNPIDLNTHKSFFVNITENNDKNIDAPSFFNTTFMIQASGSFGEVSRYIKNDNMNQYVKFKNVKHLSFRIHDDNNNDIDLNSDWLMVLSKKPPFV